VKCYRYQGTQGSLRKGGDGVYRQLNPSDGYVMLTALCFVRCSKFSIIKREPLLKDLAHAGGGGAGGAEKWGAWWGRGWPWGLNATWAKGLEGRWEAWKSESAWLQLAFGQSFTFVTLKGRTQPHADIFGCFPLITSEVWQLSICIVL
jgi:hypothetical protein